MCSTGTRKSARNLGNTSNAGVALVRLRNLREHRMHSRRITTARRTAYMEYGIEIRVVVLQHVFASTR